MTLRSSAGILACALGLLFGCGASAEQSQNTGGRFSSGAVTSYGGGVTGGVAGMGLGGTGGGGFGGAQGGAGAQG
ncbi:MAG TPA: hypothetical protein VGJ84_15240, partial [Polyangiaceae bacterium]